MPDSADLRARVWAQGKRVTPQRQIILDAIRAAGGHVTPHEIYQRVAVTASAINRATVYRNLNVLCDLRLTVATQIGGQMYYELAGAQPHHHLVCRQCDSVAQLAHQKVKQLFDKIERDQSFVVDMDHVTLFGLCAACHQKKNKVERNPKRQLRG